MAMGVGVLSMCAACRSEGPSPQGNDWPMLGRDERHSGLCQSDSPKPPLNELWNSDLGCSISASPACSGGKLYITGYDGNIHCLDAATGSILWARRIGEWPGKNTAADWVSAITNGGAKIQLHSESTPAVAGGRVFTGSYNGFFCAWDAATGRPLWRFMTGRRRPGTEEWARVQGGIDSSPCVIGEVVYFGAWDGFVYALRAQDGKLVWKHDAGDIVHWSSPAFADGRLFIGVTSGKLLSLDAASGSLIWERNICESHFEHMMCGPTVAGGIVFSGSDWEGGFHAMDAATGETLWSKKVNGLVISSPAVRGNNVFFHTASREKQGTVYAFNAKTGERIWATMIGGSSASCPVIVGDAIYVATYDAPSGDALFALNVGSGKITSSSKLSGIWGSPAAADGKLFVGTYDGRVVALGSAE